MRGGHRPGSTVPEEIAELIAHIVVAIVRSFMRAGLFGKMFGMAGAMLVTDLGLSAVAVAPTNRLAVIELVGLICVFATLLGGVFGGRRR